jgi:hypothetical protein
MSVSTTCQLRPPSSVAMIRNAPSGGSDMASPCWRSKKVMQS